MEGHQLVMAAQVLPQTLQANEFFMLAAAVAESLVRKQIILPVWGLLEVVTEEGLRPVFRVLQIPAEVVVAADGPLNRG